MEGLEMLDFFGVSATVLREHLRHLLDAECRDNPRLHSLIADAEFGRPSQPGCVFLESGERFSPVQMASTSLFALLDDACRKSVKDFVAQFARLVEERQPSRIDFMTCAVLDASMCKDLPTGDTLLTVNSWFVFDPIP